MHCGASVRKLYGAKDIKCMSVFVTRICANLGFIVHTVCHYCEMVATAAGTKVSKHLEVALTVAC